MIVYDLGNVADWLSSLGTISAVIVALYLANKDRKPKAMVTANFSYLLDGRNYNYEPVLITMDFVNIGKIPIHLSECTLQVSRFNKNRMIFKDGSHNVNKFIQPGEYYEHKLEFEHVKNYFISINKKRVKTYAYFRDATGKKYKTKINLNFN